MQDLDTREWLLTNGLGSFATGTVCDARTRTYHGWLIAALEPPNQRTLLLSHLEASLEVAGQVIALGTNFWAANRLDPSGYQWLQSFKIDPVPTWVWGEVEGWQLSRQILMPYGLSSDQDQDVGLHQPQFCNRVLVQYQYSGSEAAILRLRPLISDRDYHHTQRQTANFSFSQLIAPHQLFLQSIQAGQPGTPWLLRWTQGHYRPNNTWYWNYYYPEEAKRGLDCEEDLFSPGYITVLMQPGDRVTLEARVGLPTDPLPELHATLFEQTLQAEKQRLKRQFSQVERLKDSQTLQQQLLQSSDQFIAYRTFSGEPTILAGYPWFGEYTRDILLCLPGFALVPKRFALARMVLKQLGQQCHQGLLPHLLPAREGVAANYSIDCSLWWIEMLGLYLEATQDWEFLAEQYPIVTRIYKAFTAGTLYNIRVDASDGLITWDDNSVALTWMNASIAGQPVTPRHGKPIEVNALWYSALCWASQWATRLSENPVAMINPVSLSNQARRYRQQAQQVKLSLQKFWNAQTSYLFDRMEPDDRLNPTIRPNAVVALSLQHCAFTTEQAQQILQVACDRLLTPYGLRSLDPADPAYIGYYEGGQHQRDLAYHQGTVWSWLLGPFMRAWFRFYGPEITLPLNSQALLEHFQQQACFAAISEIFDGDAPHHPRGAIAQAAPVAELLCFWNVLSEAQK